MGNYTCKNICDRLGGTTLKPRSGERKSVYAYFNGVRFCRECERYFSAEIVKTMDRETYCPCCNRKTSGRARHGPHNMKVKMEKLLVSH